MDNNYDKLKCLWMSYGVIDYKLCDGKFDCEHCFFDRVMKNKGNKKEMRPNGNAGILEKVLGNLQRVKYDEKITYLKNNLIAKEIGCNSFYLGINPILNYFLDKDSSVTVNGCEKNISSGQKIIEISGGWGNVAISAPMDFSFYDKGGDSSSSSFMPQWLAIIGIEDQQLKKGKISQSEWNGLHENAVNIIKEVKSSSPGVGDTMLDGGTEIKSLHRLMGKSKFIKIIKELTA
jgi:hypothetical protein